MFNGMVRQACPVDIWPAAVILFVLSKAEFPFVEASCVCDRFTAACINSEYLSACELCDEPDPAILSGLKAFIHKLLSGMHDSHWHTQILPDKLLVGVYEERIELECSA
jgi:hypothetical protein